MALYVPVPRKYLCVLCRKKGDHWIMDCPRVLHEIVLDPILFDPMRARNMKMIFKKQHPVALKGEIEVEFGNKLDLLQQDQEFEFAVWKNHPIWPINKEIKTKHIKFIVMQVKIVKNIYEQESEITETHQEKWIKSREIRFGLKFDINKSTVYIKVKTPLDEFDPANSIEPIKYSSEKLTVRIDQVLKLKKQS